MTTDFRSAFFLLFMIASSLLSSQNSLSNKRTVSLYNVEAGKYYTIDSMSVIWTEFQAYSNNQLIDSNEYDLKPLLSFVRFKSAYDSVQLSYRVFSFSLQEQYYLFDSTNISPDPNLAFDPFRIIGGDQSTSNPWEGNQLSKSGALSRGISFGNNQDMNVSSSMNIQLNGKLSDDISIIASINDESIPFQTDGNTQKLQEFDKVFIQFQKEEHKLLAGDFVLNEKNNSLLQFTKKAQGLNFRSQNKDWGINTAAAISRGKFSRNKIQGLEGNQGPYKLSGANGELFVIILSGTEKIYMDGELLVRGQDRDYVIDYNTAEITFTTRKMITKDHRIIAEFQYSDQNYSRSFVYSNQYWNRDKWNVSVAVYSEQDNKNQSLQQSLTNEDKLSLSNAGDDFFSAFKPNVDSIDFTNGEVLYSLLDSTVLGVNYPEVYLYSTNPDSATYRLGFSFVGQGNGNYLLSNAGTNGRVYNWVAPFNGISQGNYEPIVLLIAPKKKQVVDVKTKYQISKHSSFYTESSVSNNDVNTFSTLDQQDNVGLALISGYQYQKPMLGKDSSLTFLSDIQYKYIQSKYSSVERIRSVEFQRDWNLQDNQLINNDHQINWKVGVKKAQNLAELTSTYFYHQDVLNAGKIKSNIKWRTKNKWFVDQTASYTNNQIDSLGFSFLRQKIALSKNLGWMKIKVQDEFEDNLTSLNGNDSISLSSYQFNHWRSSILSSDTSKTKWEVYYGERLDKRSNELIRNNTTKASEGGLVLALLKNPKNSVQINSAYRQLEILDTNLTTAKSEETFINRVNLKMTLLQGLMTSSSFYELASGQELKREFYYLQVPVGSGSYAWNDYNGNNIQELNEFEIAQYQDQAEYIRVWRPTTDYVSTFTNQFNQGLLINPSSIIKEEKGLGGFARRFSNQFAFRITRKVSNSDYWSSSNPFNNNLIDSNLVNLSSSMRNVLYFNKSNPWFGMDYTRVQNGSKILLSNGFDGRSLSTDIVNVRWNLNRIIGFKLSGEKGLKQSTSDFFTANNYLLDIQEIEPSFSYQPNVSFRFKFLTNYIEKRNVFENSEELFISKKIGTEFRYNAARKGSYSGTFSYAQVTYNGDENTPLGFDMLEGLKKGENFIWSLNVVKNLNKSLQLNIQYTGRQTGGNQVIHNGGMQLRALF